MGHLPSGVAAHPLISDDIRVKTVEHNQYMTTLDKLTNLVEERTHIPANLTNIDILQPRHFTQVVRGNYSMRDGLSDRECIIELWTPENSHEPKLAGLFVSRGCGWFNNYEVATLVTGSSRLSWKRVGNNAEMKVNGTPIGKFSLGWLLRLTYIGSGKVWFNGEPFCEFGLPFFGPSGSQRHDCTGYFKLLTCGQNVKFVLNPGGTNSFQGRKVVALKEVCSQFSRRPSGDSFQQTQNSHPIFYGTDQSAFAKISEGQRLVLLALALWPLSLYKLGAG